MSVVVHVLIFAGLTMSILLLRRALEWLLLRDARPAPEPVVAPPDPGQRQAA